MDLNRSPENLLANGIPLKAFLEATVKNLGRGSPIAISLIESFMICKKLSVLFDFYHHHIHFEIPSYTNISNFIENEKLKKSVKKLAAISKMAARKKNPPSPFNSGYHVSHVNKFR